MTHGPFIFEKVLSGFRRICVKKYKEKYSGIFINQAYKITLRKKDRFFLNIKFFKKKRKKNFSKKYFLINPCS